MRFTLVHFKMSLVAYSATYRKNRVLLSFKFIVCLQRLQISMVATSFSMAARMIYVCRLVSCTRTRTYFKRWAIQMHQKGGKVTSRILGTSFSRSSGLFISARKQRASSDFRKILILHIRTYLRRWENHKILHPYGSSVRLLFLRRSSHSTFGLVSRGTHLDPTNREAKKLHRF